MLGKLYLINDFTNHVMVCVHAHRNWFFFRDKYHNCWFSDKEYLIDNTSPRAEEFFNIQGWRDNKRAIVFEFDVNSFEEVDKVVLENFDKLLMLRELID